MLGWSPPPTQAPLTCGEELHVTPIRLAGSPLRATVRDASAPRASPARADWLWTRPTVTTQRASLKARAHPRQRARPRARRGHGRSRVRGARQWVEDRPDLRAAAAPRLLAQIGARSLWMGRYIAKGLARKTSVLIRVTPAPQLRLRLPHRRVRTARRVCASTTSGAIGYRTAEGVADGRHELVEIEGFLRIPSTRPGDGSRAPPPIR